MCMCVCVWRLGTDIKLHLEQYWQRHNSHYGFASCSCVKITVVLSSYIMNQWANTVLYQYEAFGKLEPVISF